MKNFSVSSHGGVGRRFDFAPLCYCGEKVITRTARTAKNRGRKGWGKHITKYREMYYEFGKMGQSVVCNGLFVVCVKHIPFHNEVNLLM